LAEFLFETIFTHGGIIPSIEESSTYGTVGYKAWFINAFVFNLISAVEAKSGPPTFRVFLWTKVHESFRTAPIAIRDWPVSTFSYSSMLANPQDDFDKVICSVFAGLPNSARLAEKSGIDSCLFSAVRTFDGGHG